MNRKYNPNLKRIIVDYSKLTDHILDLLVTKYPDGYSDFDIISFKNKEGVTVDCVEVLTADTLYLVKVSKRLAVAMEDYEDDAYQGTDDTNTESYTSFDADVED
ncbi:MAG: hypothetical protein ABNH00_10615 [Dokdonia sp.]|jgi:hypothetical protein|nr:hypothetical protein [Cytophagaceae bacterium]|tara:strand:- start:26 stop:337 length:312 start_codon:yes stop_codon:yes gene_type:complete